MNLLEAWKTCKIKEQAEYITGEILLLSNSANSQRDCKTLIWIIVSIIYVEKKTPHNNNNYDHHKV